MIFAEVVTLSYYVPRILVCCCVFESVERELEREGEKGKHLDIILETSKPTERSRITAKKIAT